MKPFLFILFIAFMGLSGCSSAKKAGLPVIDQGIAGQITELRGNQMPMVDGPPRSAPKGIRTTVYVYEPTNIRQVRRTGDSPVYTAIVTKRVALVETDDAGKFQLSLPPGSYSIFIKQGNNYFANLFDTQNNIALFVVESGKLTTVNLTVNSAATF